MEEASYEQWVNRAWERIVEKIGRTSRRIGATFPHASKNGTYDAMRPSWWTAGFWPGLLWLIYRETGDERLKSIAEECERLLDGPLHQAIVHHDVGFIWILTAVANYKITGSEESKRRALIAAGQLAGRYNARGRFIRAWHDTAQQNRAGWSIIDTMMNIALLYWATETTADPRFKHIAVDHADTVLREFIRPDGSTHHIVCFDPETGARLEARAGQGHSPDSAWSRGTAWALYGMAISYAYTREDRFLQAAKRVAHFFIANLPADRVPYWDFRVPAGEGTPRDSSAGACAACGLIELSKLVPPAESALYFDAAVKILQSLYENYSSWDADEEALLLHATGSAPSGANVDVPLIYGDYFFVEGIAKLRDRRSMFW